MNSKTLRVAGTVVLVVASAALGFSLDFLRYGHKLRFGAGEVYYKSPVTEAEAKQVGAFLSESFFVGTTRKSVQVRKKNGEPIVKFVLKEGAWNDPSVQRIFTLLANQVSASIFDGQPVTVKLCDKSFDTQHTTRSDGQLGIRHVIVPKQAVFARAPVTKAEATKVSDTLQKAGFFSADGNAREVVLGKTNMGFTITFLVKDGIWDRADMIAAFKDLGQRVSTALGATAVVQLADTTHNVKKTL